ncbi:hypothetical protein SCA6_002996 [Theobroma cacao]
MIGPHPTLCNDFLEAAIYVSSHSASMKAVRFVICDGGYDQRPAAMHEHCNSVIILFCTFQLPRVHRHVFQLSRDQNAMRKTQLLWI